MRTKIVVQRGEILARYELTDEPSFKVDDFDYLSDDELDTPRFVKLHDDWVDVFDIMPETRSPDWDGYISDTFFSRYVVKFLDGDDEGFVRIGFQTS